MTFSKEIIEILDYLGKQLGIAIDWSAANVMPYLQDLMGRFVGFKIAESGIWFGISVLGIVLGIFFVKNGMKLWKKRNIDWDYEFYAAGFFIGAFFIFGFSIAGVFVNIFNIVQCHFLPEKIIYEYIQTLLPK